MGYMPVMVCSPSTSVKVCVYFERCDCNRILPQLSHFLQWASVRHNALVSCIKIFDDYKVTWRLSSGLVSQWMPTCMAALAVNIYSHTNFYPKH